MGDAFQRPLVVTPNADGVLWRLDAPFSWAYISVPAGFKTDFASIPPLSLIGGVFASVAFVAGWQWLFWAAMAVVLISHLLLHTGSYTRAAVIHDWLYSTRQLSRSASDWALFEAMRACGTHLWKRCVIWLAVRCFGWACWHRRRLFGSRIHPSHARTTAGGKAGQQHPVRREPPMDEI